MAYRPAANRKDVFHQGHHRRESSSVLRADSNPYHLQANSIFGVRFLAMSVLARTVTAFGWTHDGSHDGGLLIPIIVTG